MPASDKILSPYVIFIMALPLFIISLYYPLYSQSSSSIPPHYADLIKQHELKLSKKREIPTHLHKGYLSIPKEDDKYTHYPHAFKQLGQSMNLHLKHAYLYMSYMANMNMAGYRVQKITSYLDKDNNITPVKWVLWKKGYPRLTNRTLDFYVTGKSSFFSIRLPNGQTGLTHDGRLILNQNGLLVTLSNQFPVLGKKGLIYLDSDEVMVNQYGEIFNKDNKYIDSFHIRTFDSTHGLWTINGTFHFVRDPKKSKETHSKHYRVVQGEYEDSNLMVGKRNSKMIEPYYEAGPHTVKKLVKAYNDMFKAVAP